MIFQSVVMLNGNKMCNACRNENGNNNLNRNMENQEQYDEQEVV